VFLHTKILEKFHSHRIDNLLNFPPFPTEDEICSDNKVGPFGNGGMSIHSRLWMKKAIQYCPSYLRSGFSEEEVTSSPCWLDVLEGSEDFYFAMILKGMGAPLPTVYEASLFSSEMRVPENFVHQYILTNIELEQFANS